MVKDGISDFIIRLKNASRAGKISFDVPFTKINKNISEVLKREGYIVGYQEKGRKNKMSLEIEILKEGTAPVIEDVKRISKPSKRVYIKSSELRPVKRGYGILVLSTPKGIMSNVLARKEKVGGEALFEIW